jgi:uncharacterized protein YjbI with pentapeptide repeats
MTELDLRGTDLSGLSFEGIDLAYSKLADADLSRCSFKGANLTSVSLWHANLKDASFEGAVLDFADMDCANIDGCTFKGARLKKTILPNPRTSLTQVEDSVRTGRRVAFKADELDFE